MVCGWSTDCVRMAYGSCTDLVRLAYGYCTDIVRMVYVQCCSSRASLLPGWRNLPTGRRSSQIANGQSPMALGRSASIEVRPRGALDLHRVVPQVVIEVLAVHLDFAALEVGGLGAQRRLGGKQFPAPVEVDDHPVAVLVAAIEVGNLRIAGFLHPVGGVGRQPAPRGDVDFGPIVDAPGGRLGFPPALPACRDAGDAAEGDEDGILDAAVAAPGSEAFNDQGWDGAVFVLGIPFHVGADPAEQHAGLGQWVGLLAE